MLLLVIPASVVPSVFEFGYPEEARIYSRSENPTSVASPRALPTVIQKYIIYTDGQKYNIWDKVYFVGFSDERAMN